MRTVLVRGICIQISAGKCKTGFCLAIYGKMGALVIAKIFQKIRVPEMDPSEKCMALAETLFS